MFTFNKLQALIISISKKGIIQIALFMYKYLPKKRTVLYHLQDYKSGLAYKTIIKHFGGCKSCEALNSLHLISAKQRNIYRKVAFETQFQAASRQLRQ